LHKKNFPESNRNSFLFLGEKTFFVIYLQHRNILGLFHGAFEDRQRGAGVMAEQSFQEITFILIGRALTICAFFLQPHSGPFPKAD
jgi:hypothetical protein